jgi:hypothetical protein
VSLDLPSLLRVDGVRLSETGLDGLLKSDGLRAWANFDSLDGFFNFSSAWCVSGVGGDRTRLGTEVDGGDIVGSSR